jgi:chromatin modification-related protein VID21
VLFSRQLLHFFNDNTVNQRKAPAIHETHAQYSKMTKHTPAELSRMKAEKEARDIHDLQLARRRQEELNRQNTMLQQANRINLPVGFFFFALA